MTERHKESQKETALYIYEFRKMNCCTGISFQVNFCTRLPFDLKGHSQPYDRADLDPSFVTFEKSLPQPEIKPRVEIHLEIGFNLVQCSVRFSIFY